MPKITDVAAYWKEQAVKAGLDADTLKQVEPLLANPAFQKTLTEAFKPLPDYSADLDATRDKAVKDTDAKYKTWYEQEQAKYNLYTSVLDEHGKYKEKYGALDAAGGGGAGDGGGGGGGNGNGGRGEVLTREEVEQLLARRDANALDYMEIRERHLTDFKKPLDRKAFETFWKEHPDYATMPAAYKEFVSPELEKTRAADWDAKMKAKYEEGLRDGASRRGLPTSTGGKEFSPILDQKRDVLKLDEREQDKHSREAFFTGLNNPTEDSKK